MDLRSLGVITTHCCTFCFCAQGCRDAQVAWLECAAPGAVAGAADALAGSWHTSRAASPAPFPSEQPAGGAAAASAYAAALAGAVTPPRMASRVAAAGPLLLAIYAPKRSALELWQSCNGGCVASVEVAGVLFSLF
jgi:hypothetical protein